MTETRKKSPRAPSIALDEAIDGAVRVYEKERRHAAPTDAVAQHLGYKSANNGAALSVLASLRYYGLLERPEEGKLAVTKEVEAFRFAPSADLKSGLQIKWLKTPTVFSELLDKYPEGLPSDATIRYDLIQRGFSPSSAESVLSVFRRSVDYARFFEERKEQPTNESAPPIEEPTSSRESAANRETSDTFGPELQSHDRIPVRLTAGRRAWLEIPAPFYEADKKRLKDQIDLLLTEDEDDKQS